MDKRPVSGKGERYEFAKKKYELFQNKQDKLLEMDNILTGKQKETIVPKPGEFVIVSTDKKFDPSAELALGLDDLLESARQTIKSRMESARKSTKRKVIRGSSQPGASMQSNMRSNPSFQQTAGAEDGLLSSISSQPQRRFPLAALSKQQNEALNTISGSRNDQSPIEQQSESLTARGPRPTSSVLTSGRVLFKQESEASIFHKQKMIAYNPDMKTSMTTSIRNIMRKQDKELLTQSSRLLHSQLEAFEQQMANRANNLQTLEANKSTFDLLASKIPADQNLQTIQPTGSMLPSLSKSFLQPQQMQTDSNLQGTASSFFNNPNATLSQKTLARPDSAYVLFGGDKDLLKQAKQRINLKDSRKRDIITPQLHTYRPQPQKYQIDKVKDASLAANVKPTVIPTLVQQQIEMKKELDPTSPFLEVQEVPQMVIKEPVHKVIQSPIFDAIYQQIEERERLRDNAPLRYTYNLDQIKALRLMSESPVREQKAKAKTKQIKQSKDLAPNKMTEEDMRILSKKFLPIEAYDPQIDTEDPIKIIEDYRDPHTGHTHALSKWQFPNGDFEMRQCTVLRYLQTEELYEIVWDCNGSTKKASRFNLLFLLEDKDEYQKRIEEAKHHREQAEIIMKYYYMIENTKIQKFDIADDEKTRISYKIASFNPLHNIIMAPEHRFRDPEEFLSREAKDKYEIPKKLLSSKQLNLNLDSSVIVQDIHRDFLKTKFNLQTLGTLFSDLDKEYLRAHKQIYFDSQLPYSTEKYTMFRSILPRDKFIPVSERIVGETDRKGLIQIDKRSIQFKDLLGVMKHKLHQANKVKLDSLMRVNVNMIKFAPMLFFKLNYKTPQSKEMFIKTNRVQSGEVIREVRNCMFDSQYEIHSMIATEAKRIGEINAQRKKAASYQSMQFKEEAMSDDFVSDMSQFQMLLNMLYERAIRTCYQQSLTKLIQSLDQVIEFMNESIDKDIRFEEITESDVVRMSNDPVLAKRMESYFQLKISIKFNKDTGLAQLDPPVDEWLREIKGLIEYNMEELSFVPCFSANEIGSARENGKVRVFPERAEDPFVVQSLQELYERLEALFKLPIKAASIVAQYSSILATDIKKFKHEYKVNDYPVDQYKGELELNQIAKDHLQKLLFEDRLQCGLFFVKGDKIKKQFLNKIEELNKVLFSCVKTKIDQTNSLIEQEVEHILSIINKDPIRDIEELTEIQDFINNLDKKMYAIRDLIQDVMGKMGLLEDYQYRLLEEEFNRTWISFSKPLEIFRAEYDCRRRMKKDEREFFQDLRIMNERLLKDFDDIKIEFDILQRSEDLTEYEDSVVKCDILLEKVERAIAIAEIANRREGLFKLKKTDFNEIDQLRVQFMPYNTMWNLSRDYFYKINTWMNGPLCDIDRDKITADITDACQTLLRLEKLDFKERKATGIVCNQLRKLYEEFKPYLPLIISLRNPSLKMRHWASIQKLKNPPLEIDHELRVSIQEMIEEGVMEIIEDINEISDFASREKKLEDALSKMKDEWRHVKFELAEFRDSGTHVLKGAEPIWDLLDDHIMKTMTIAASPYIKFLQSEVNYWKQTLVKVQEILEEWTKVQRGWLYLWPIFSSEDIQKQMPIISASFQTVDKIWRNIMLGTAQNPNVLDACLQGRVFENFQQCNEMIDRIQKGLNEYLNTKRMAFPRFFFLSNDDLLHILSQTKDPLRVQDHLNKCFEGIDKIEFSGDKKILGMYSSMGEYIAFISPVEPFNKETGEVRNVEDWLTEVETQMRDSLRDLIIKSSAKYSADTRKDWIFEWPSQIVLTLDQVFWTSSIEKEGILKMKDNSQALKKVFQKEETKLQELVNLIKVPRNNQVHLLTLGALIVLDVHAKDVTKDLAFAQVRDIAAFDWISQLRYYVIEEKGKNKEPLPIEINVKMVNCTRLYGFEYLGNQTRLVITPLTDRCYRTLMGALQLNLGGAPEGPAGTGKTETTKDLAKAIAKQCIVFNCSDQLNVDGMAKFFKGLVCCGAWACFDEFNRIELEVLSVIAQQILTIQIALMRRRPQAPFMFDDEQIPMNPTCAVFITMNPGYAGRSELPDNLKALFRPVAMMIPNYAMIAEISLYSFGFQNARELSIKITQSLRLASEQLSTQSHYDYGMRAVKSIILAAGALKREYQDEDESKLVLRAISDCNIPKFLTDDIPLFEGIISDLFPTTDKAKPDYDVLIQAIKETQDSRNLQENEEFETKAIQLFETVQVRHGLMMVGAIMSAKTEIIRTLAEALTLVNKKAAMSEDSQQSEDEGGRKSTAKKQYEKVKINTINPKSISIGQLYGDFDKISHDWSDGVLATAIKDCATDKSGNRRWILLDGPVDAVWIENLNTVLDDNKKLCLSSGEIIKFTPKMTMMFEVEDLLEASPATVSRCGMVYLNPDKLGWQVQINSWLQTLPSQLRVEGRMQIYSELIKFFIPDIMGYLFGYDLTLEEEKRLEHLKPVIGVTKNWMFRSFLSLFESLLMKNETRQTLLKKEQEARDKEEAKRAIDELKGYDSANVKRKNSKFAEKGISGQQKTEIFNQFLMACVWSFGATLHSNGRFLFSEYLHERVQKIINDQSQLSFGSDLQMKQMLDETYDYYSHFYSPGEETWHRWDYQLDTLDVLGRPKKSAQEKKEEEDSEDHLSSNVPVEQEIEFQSIMIPTEDTMRYSFILHALTNHSFPVLFIGETGTGKTSAIKKYQTQQLSKDEWEIGQMVFSATSTAFQVQDYIQSKVEKQKKGVYGPKLPGHRLLIFIDDLSMPAKEKYGAQPPIEMLRQTIDNGGFYDLSNNELLKIVDVQFVSAMGIPGGGRSLPSKRLLRHFNLIHITPFSNDNLFRIFSKILEWGFSKHPEQWLRQTKVLTNLTIAVYDKAVKTLLPLPSKSHYLFNLRQVSEVIQGLLMVPLEVVEKMDTGHRLGMLQRLWVHESVRVFSDRLINEEDKQKFMTVLTESIQQVQPGYIDLTKINPDKIIFNNFIEFNPLDPTYTECQDLVKMKQTINDIIEYYNSSNSKDKLHLLIFDYVIQHLSRIARIIYKPHGNGLLIGLGGNGRRSLAKLAAYINDCQVFKVDVIKSYGPNEWQEDMKSMFKALGVDNKKLVFTISDSDIKQDYLIEDINNILNVGEVPNLFNPEEIDEIKFELEKHASRRAGGTGDPHEMFMKRCKKNLHLLIYMSPAGNKLREYIRQYPSLVNCTSIDWFLSWPEEALQTVSQFYLEETRLFERKIPKMIRRLKRMPTEPITQPENEEDQVPLGEKIQEQQTEPPQEVWETFEEELSQEDQVMNATMESLQNKVSDIFVQIHNAALSLATTYFNEKRRQVYITPTRFIEIFKLFEKIMKRKHKQLDEERQKYLIGIQKLEEANVIVDRMKLQLEDLKPILETKSRQVEQTMVRLDKETKEVEAAKEIVDKEAQVVYEQKEVAEGIKNECQARLSEAQPLLDEALKALKTLNVKDFVTMKSYNQPPYPIKLALEAACIMLGVAPKMLDGPVNKVTKKATKIPDYWEKSKKLLNDYKKFLGSLENYDKDNIPDDRIAKIQEYLSNPKFVPDEIRKASEAAEGICKWVIAICKYDIIAKEIRPKRADLATAQEKLNIVVKQLNEKQAQLQQIIDKKNALEEDFKNQNMEKQNLIMQRDECQAKLNRATILMNSLGNEKDRWLQTCDKLLRDKESLLGDMILSTAFVTYLGPFEGSYREKILRQDWRQIVQSQDIQIGHAFKLEESISSLAVIQQWQLKGLPQDSLSIENMIIIDETISDKWPLIIDPQGQALKFIKDFLDQDFISIKLQSDNYARKLEPALVNGHTVICENVGEYIDPSMNSIIGREIQMIGKDKYVKFNENQVEFSDSFRLYLISNLANPHFTPEIHAKTRVLNFSVTKEGLEQQLLSIVCKHEASRDEDEREKLMRQNIEFQEQKRVIEEQILNQLRNAGQDILDDDVLVNSLNESKKITDDIKQKLTVAKVIEERIEENRKNYKPVAEHGAKLYFCVQDLPLLDPMYQFSMKWFREMFEKSFTYSDKVKDLRGRIKQLKNDFRKILYANVCRSLFEKHKLMFAFSMAIKLNEDDGSGVASSVGDSKSHDFGKKLKELEQMQANAYTSNMPGGYNIVGSSKHGKSIIDKKSDNSSQVGGGGFNQAALNLLQKNEEERLRIPRDHLKYLLTGLLPPDTDVEERPNPGESFIDDKMWQQVLEIAAMDYFETLPDEIERNPVQWKKFIQYSDEQVPDSIANQIPEFSMILLHKVLKPEKTILMIQRYIEKALGSFFIKPIIFTFEEIFADSKPNVPILLILTPGNDPMEQIKKFGEDKNRMPYPVSLGRGQGEKAKAIINEIRQYGGWVVLQNCHLAVSFLPELEQIIEQLQPTQSSSRPRNTDYDDSNQKKEHKVPHVDFRLWLTSMSNEEFPFSILQNSIKVTSEPPKGIKASLMRTYTQVDSSKAEKEFFNSNSKPDQWHKLFLALSFFHAIVRERRRYGALGWNLTYDFNDSDFRISMRQLHLMIDTFDQIPFTALSYLTGECNYGGRVTDDWDRRTLTTILKDFYTTKALVSAPLPRYEFIEGQNDYYILQDGEFSDYFTYVEQLPDEENPQLVGLHANANITYAINEAMSLIHDVLTVNANSSNSESQPSSGPVVSQNQQAMKMAREILVQIREPFKVKEVDKKYPFTYSESMNSVLLQELARFNTLIEVVKQSLETLIKTLEGKLVMNPEIERMLKSIMNNTVPDIWRARSYPSRKPLTSYVKDLMKRLSMLEDWIAHGQPAVFWISGFFFTQSFLTGVKQNFARKYRHPIDKVTFSFEVLKYETEINSPPENGCYIRGLFLEGAGWNNHDGTIEESQPKQLYVEMPVMHFIPTLVVEKTLDDQPERRMLVDHRNESQMSENQSSINDASQMQVPQPPSGPVKQKYNCPVYKTSSRAGTLSTTGHSTNYILTVELDSFDSEDKWVKRSVAMHSQLDD